MWGLAAWVDRFQADLWLRQTGEPFTGWHDGYRVRAVWTECDQLDVEIGKGAKMEFRTKKPRKKRGWVWELMPIEPTLPDQTKSNRARASA